MKVDLMVRPGGTHVTCPKCAQRVAKKHVRVGEDADGPVFRQHCTAGHGFSWQEEPPEEDLVSEPGMTREEFRARVQEHYGLAGLYAAESMCLDATDYALGYDHCVDKIAPALEEELDALDAVEEAEEESPEAVLDQFLIR